MNRLTNWIKEHQVVAFFILTFAISWGMGFSYGAVMKWGQFLFAPLVFLATCGPALAGVIISAISNTSPREGKKRTVWIDSWDWTVKMSWFCTLHRLARYKRRIFHE